MNIQSSKTIYVGNIQSIDDDTLREYFQRFGEIEALYHNGARAADEWLIDYRFIRFSPNTDVNIFVSHKIDHTICRIRLDIHSYDAAFLEETRLMSDRKICIAHTNPKLDRNIVKKVSGESLMKSKTLSSAGIHTLRTNLELQLCIVGQWCGIRVHRVRFD